MSPYSVTGTDAWKQGIASKTGQVVGRFVPQFVPLCENAEVGVVAENGNLCKPPQKQKKKPTIFGEFHW